MFDDEPERERAPETLAPAPAPEQAPPTAELPETETEIPTAELPDSAPPDAEPPLDEAPTEPPPETPETPETPDSEPVAVELPMPRAVVRDDDDEEMRVELPDELPILPLKDTVVYPFAVTPLGVGKDRSIRLIDDVMRGPRLVGLVAQKDENVEDAGPDDCFRIGTVARIARLLRIPDGTIQIIVQGLERIVIDEYTAEQPFLKARCHLAPEPVTEDFEIEALKRTAIDLFQRLVNLVQYLPDQLAMAAMNLDDARQVV